MKENMEQKERVEAPVQEPVVTKKPFYKRKGFWAAMIVCAAALIGGGYAYKRSAGSKGNNPETNGEAEETPRQQEHRDREDRSGNNRDWRRHGNERNNSNN